MAVQMPYLAAPGEAPARADLGATAREKREKVHQARMQRVGAQFVRDNTGRTVGVVALFGLLAGMILMRR